MALIENIQELKDVFNSLETCKKAELSEMVLNKALDNNDLSLENYTEIMTGVENGKAIPIFNSDVSFGVLAPSNGDCSKNPANLGIKLSGQSWNPKAFNARIEICLESVSAELKAFWNLRREDYDNDASAFIVFISEIISREQAGAIFRIAFFNDENEIKPILGGINGIFTQLEAEGDFVEIEANNGASWTDQKTLTETTAKEVFEKMYNKAIEDRDIDLDATVIYCTKELSINYLKYVRTVKEDNCCYNTNGLTDTNYNLDNLNYLGIRVVVVKTWSKIINKLFWDGSNNSPKTKPHRAILTNKKNLVTGTSDEKTFKNFDIFYDRVSNKFICDIETFLDARVVEPSKTVLAI